MIQNTVDKYVLLPPSIQGEKITSPLVLFKVDSITPDTMRNTQEPREMTFHCHTQFPGETHSSFGDDGHTAVWATTHNTGAHTGGGGYGIMTVGQFIPQLYTVMVLILLMYACLQFSPLQMVPYALCLCA